MDCSLPGSSIHGIFQARVLEWGAIAFSIAYTTYILFQAPPGSQASSRGEAKDSALLSSRDAAHTPAACSFPGENARSWGALGEACPGQSSLSAGALRYRAWAQSWSSAQGKRV